MLLFEPCGVGFGSDSEVSEGQDMFACAGFVFGDGGELGLPYIGEVECFVVFVGEVGILFGVDGVEDIECSGVVATYGKAVGDMDVGMLLLLGRGGESICLVGIGKCGVVVEAVVLLPYLWREFVLGLALCHVVVVFGGEDDVFVGSDIVLPMGNYGV